MSNKSYREKMIKDAAHSIRTKYLSLQRDKEKEGEEDGEHSQRTKKSLKSSSSARVATYDPDTIKLIDKHSRNVKKLYDSLKARRYENARVLESTYRSLAKILSTTKDKTNTAKLLTPKKFSPGSLKRPRSEPATLVKKPRQPLQFDVSREEHAEGMDIGPVGITYGKDYENPVGETSPAESLSKSINLDDFDDDNEYDEHVDLNKTVYEYNPRESFFYDDDFRLEPNGKPIHSEHIADESFQDYIEQFDELPRHYVEGFIRNTNNEYDRTYLRHDYVTDHIYFGDSKLNFNGPDIVIKGETFKGTPGLYELIFKSLPLKNKFTASDERTFAKIILLTNAHKRNFKPNEPNIGNRGPKYQFTIKPILKQIKAENEKKQQYRDKELRMRRTGGYGLNNNGVIRENKVHPQYKELSNNEIDYVHWDDPNKLVDRLRLLLGSQSAGNNNINNEIISIEEELREAGIII